MGVQILLKHLPALFQAQFSLRIPFDRASLDIYTESISAQIFCGLFPVNYIYVCL